MGYGGLNLPTDVPANQYVTFGGLKASKSRGVGRPLGWYLDRFETDGLRYAIAQSLPESNDSELSDDEIVRRINDELVAAWGNLVNRVVSMTSRYFDGVVPTPSGLSEPDTVAIDRSIATLEETGAALDAIRLRSGIARAMQGAQDANAYLSDLAPWQTAKTDMERTATTLWVATQLVAATAVALSPYLPSSSRIVLETLGVTVPDHGPQWTAPVVEPGTVLGDLGPLFAKVELEPED
jgi:methionyl-tRNA synthetase